MPQLPLIPILAQSGLYLEPFGHGDESRFANIFAETWKAIPLGDRCRMLKHWRTNCPERRIILDLPCGAGDWKYQIPRIQLLRGWGKPSTGIVYNKPNNNYVQDGGIFGLCEAKGYLMRFWSKPFDAMPDRIAQHLIAHELAHVFQHATCVSDSFDNESESESNANDLVQKWSFATSKEFDTWAECFKLALLRKCLVEKQKKKS